MTIGRVISSSRPALNGDGFGIIVIEFLAGLSLFSQIRGGFGYCY